MDQPMKHKLSEAVTDLEPDVAADGNAPTAQASHEQGKGPSHKEIAEETRREQQARPSGRPDREDYLVNVGRGQQTHG